MTVVSDATPRKEVGRVALAEVREKGLVRVPHPPFDVLVAWVDGEVFAIEDACNHAGASLSEGWLEEDCVVCPMHAYVFELRTGRLQRPKGLCGDQRTYEAEVEGDEIVVYDTFSLVIG
ncbi:MAG: Rieske 2Fe-2S domain-containing protein [Labilithrix sp.]|nr:Rieske 2Fe-2S domain-containing protein [Labilithrix sp.]